MKIEKGIPVPPRYKGAYSKHEISAVMRQMEIGDSVYLPLNETNLKNVQGLRTMVSLASKSANITCTTRADNDGVRFWRIK